MGARNYMADYMSNRRKTRRQKYIQMLGGECSNCGDTENLQFDHIKSRNKKYDLNDIKDGNEKVILKELKKCVLLCPSCHLEKSLREKDLVNKNKEPSTHGKIWHYKRYKCRCDKCKSAMSNYIKLKNSVK